MGVSYLADHGTPTMSAPRDTAQQVFAGMNLTSGVLTLDIQPLLQASPFLAREDSREEIGYLDQISFRISLPGFLPVNQRAHDRGIGHDLLNAEVGSSNLPAPTISFAYLFFTLPLALILGSGQYVCQFDMAVTLTHCLVAYRKRSMRVCCRSRPGDSILSLLPIACLRLRRVLRAAALSGTGHGDVGSSIYHGPAVTVVAPER
jgi:hypothetical protein